jgi:hypothetical protein
MTDQLTEDEVVCRLNEAAGRTEAIADRLAPVVTSAAEAHREGDELK